jgi:signal transduction histidine kinase
MAKKKGISISLAAKCQLLFGLAVLVIIAGALAVPWQRMEQLAKQPNIKAAHFAADVLFRELHQGLGGSNFTAPATGPETRNDSVFPSPTTRPAVKWGDAKLSDVEYAPPRMLVVSSPRAGFASQQDATDVIAGRALRRFRETPDADYGEVETVKDRSVENNRIYRFAAAVRLDSSCIRCHEEYTGWMDGTVGSAAGPATNLATTRPSEASVGPVVGVVRVDVPYQTDENQLLLNRIVIVVAGMLGGALAIVVFYLITSRLILQPVRVLKNTAEKVAHGDLNIRSAISTGDEFQQLSETFNTMLATLKGSQDQLEATNRSLDTRVGELAQSNVDLYEANRLKSEFLTNVTHELRTPLNAIIGFADLMAETAGRGGDAKQQRYSENIRTSAKQLLDLINDLLDLAKIEAGKLVLREEKVSVADVCEAMANFMRPLAQKKNIALELSIDPEMPLIATDPGRFQQILYNFLSNAIKFTPTDGRVAIVARGGGTTAPAPVPPSIATPAPSDLVGIPNASAMPVEALSARGPMEIRISITDTGPGISLEDQQVIFDKFRQLDGSVTRQHSGSGLGLTISRELANMLGGRIELTSTPGKGATFSLIMPTENPHRTIEVHSTLENV